MCGILGIFDDKSLNEGILVQMRDTLVHRGPDDSGIWLSRDKRIGLAHRRLSIIDLSQAGRQPMSDDEGKICLTFNGEIYNFKEIREVLIDKGYKFKSHTDTEVIINSYKEWGTECLSKFNGMFAFGIYDDRKKIFFLARDRTGKKPLYYSSDKSGRRFYFASEIKAILKDRRVSKELNLRSLNYFFTYGYIPGDESIFKGIRKLPPAGAMVYSLQTGQEEIWNYWDPPELQGPSASEDELLEELEELIQDSVKQRMVSDVPLGAFLSGGVDSSLIVAMMSRAADKPVKTFSIGFEDNAFNELPYARVVADYFKTEHHELIVKPDAFNILPELVRQFDEPFADSSMIPTYYVSQATREHVTVALSGDGGDELFGGYRHYLAAMLHYNASRYLPSFIRRSVSRTAELMPEKGRALIKRQLMMLKLDPYEAFVRRSSDAHFKIDDRMRLFNNEIKDTLIDELPVPEQMLMDLLGKRSDDFINRMTYTDFKTYLPDDVLFKVDRTSMMVSLEVRSPLLDYRIADFSFGRICGGLKVKRLTTKYLLKKLAKKILPPELDIDRKQGFAIPISKWFRGPLKSDINDIILGGNDHLFDRKYVIRLIDEHVEGCDHSGRLFALLVFCLWKREYLC